MSNRISGFQLYCLGVFLILTSANIVEPRHMINDGQNNGWILAAFAGIGSLVYVLVYFQLIKRTPADFTLLVKSLLGKWGGQIILLFYLGFLLFSCALTLRFFASFLLSVVMVLTPISVLIAILLLASTWAARQGIVTIARVGEISFWINTLLGLMALIMASSNIDLNNLLPVLPNGLLPLAGATWKHSHVFAELFFLVLLTPFLKNNKKAHVPLLASVLTSTLWLSILTLFAVGIFNHYLAEVLAYPTLSVIRSISIGQFIERVDILLIALWVLNAFIKTSLLLFIFGNTAAEWLGLQDHRPLVPAAALMVAPLSILIFSNTVEQNWFYDYLWYRLMFILAVVIPLILLIISYLRGGETHAQKMDGPVSYP